MMVHHKIEKSLTIITALKLIQWNKKYIIKHVIFLKNRCKTLSEKSMQSFAIQHSLHISWTFWSCHLYFQSPGKLSALIIDCADWDLADVPLNQKSPLSSKKVLKTSINLNNWTWTWWYSPQIYNYSWLKKIQE